MSIAKSLVALGNWIEKHFPEKLTATEVNERYTALESAFAETARRAQVAIEKSIELQARVAELEKKAEVFNSDINKTKVMLLTQRQATGR